MGLAEAAFTERRPALVEALEAMRGSSGADSPTPTSADGRALLAADPGAGPPPEIAAAGRETQARVLEFAARVHDGQVRPPRAGRFRRVLVIGIGGSALGPKFVADALGYRADRMRPYFLDNTDPDGFARDLGGLGAGWPDARARDLEVGRHARDAQRHAEAASGLREARPRPRAPRGRGDPGRQCS